VVVEALAREQLLAGHKVTVFGLCDEGWRRGQKGNWDHVSVEALKVIGPDSIGFSPQMARAIEAWSPDVVHLHGLWMHPTRSVLQWQKRTGRPFILSSHGMLSKVALGYSPAKKRLARLLFQDLAFERAACLHATGTLELDEIRNFGLRGPVAVIPNGVRSVTKPYFEPIQSHKTVLSLGRVHRKKGLDVLIEAWALLESEYPDWCLRIVGPDEGNHTAELSSRVAELGLSRSFFAGAMYGAERDLEMAKADIFVLPTRSENFALTVAESLMLEVPVVSSKGAPWSALEDNGCGRWVELNPKTLAEALAELMNQSDETRREMGRRGREWMLRDFTWPELSNRFVDIYSWVRGRAPLPKMVHKVHEDHA
jgi:glycosyltransferase involved in cell wall biosynthesis